MSSIFFSNFISTISNEMIIIVGLSIIVLALASFIIKLNNRLGKILKGKDCVSIEDTIVTLTKQIKTLEEFQIDSEKYLTSVERRLRNSVQSVETIRFNPFKGSGTGGNQSFATAFLNENGDGLVISSLYSSDRMSIFAKPVEHLESEFDLTDEEKKVLVRAGEKVKGAGSGLK